MARQGCLTGGPTGGSCGSREGKGLLRTIHGARLNRFYCPWLKLPLNISEHAVKMSDTDD